VKPIRFALAALVGLAMTPALADISIGITVDTAPPELPVYDQPPLPEPGYIWVPGFWAWNPDGGYYYWVPGTWVEPPAPGLLWTPAWWGWDEGHFVFHRGYWGPHVGFYGGIYYGYGYSGDGYRGGRWEGDHFTYNRTVNNFGGVHVTNVYSEAVVNNTTINHISYNGGSGGVRAQPSQADRIAEHEQHREPTNVQVQHVQMAASHQELRALENHGHPPIAAAARPAEFSGPGVLPAHGAPAPAPRPAEQRPAPQPQPQQAPHPAAPAPQPSHPAPIPQPPPQAARPAPQPQPAPQQPHPQPQYHPQPQPQPPQPHPQAQPQQHPQPPGHPNDERKEPPHGSY